MSDWGQGYQVGIPYTVGFYSELAPNHLESALLFAGFRVNLAKAGATYCELGCGYGLTTLILAASNPQISFVGVDFNPTHIVAANALAESAHLRNVRFVEASFDELLDPRFADLGEFDVIALHGIYSWVAPSVRRAIVKFADAKLKTGGVLYVSYNAAPGWMPRAPLQRLLTQPGSSTLRAKEQADCVCPECGHRFKGDGFGGIDAHWRAKHDDVMPYEEAWPLIKSNSYSNKAAR